MPKLFATLNPLNGVPGFLIPLFIDPGASNNILIQNLDKDGKILSFDDFYVDHENVEVFSDKYNINLNVRDDGLWAFISRDRNIILGSAKEISNFFLDLLKRDDFSSEPFLALEMAKFCNSKDQFNHFVRAAYSNIRGLSESSAALWRNATILLPAVKRDLRKRMEANGKRTMLSLINEVRIYGLGQDVEILIPDELRRILGISEPTDRSILEEAKSLLALFGTSVSVRSFRERAKPPLPNGTDQTQTDEGVPHAVVYGLGGVGSRVADSSPNSLRKFTPVFPSHLGMSKSSVRELTGKRPPLFGCAVLGSNSSDLSHAMDAAAIWANEGTTRFAIAFRPIGFGSPRKEKLTVFDLFESASRFDQVFVVGNHILHRPSGVAPNLMASSRAAGLAKSSIKALVDFAFQSWMEPKLYGFQSEFPQGGLGLLGRIWHSTVFTYELDRDVALMLQENLPLRKARRILAIGPGVSARERQAINRSMYKIHGVKSRMIDYISLPPTRNRKKLIFLGLGIVPIKSTIGSFKDFCSRLLISLGWSMLENSASHRNEGTIRAQILSKRVMFLLSTDVNSNFSEIELEASVERKLNLCIVTNYNPSSVQVSVGRSIIPAIHYSRLDDWTSRFPLL